MTNKISTRRKILFLQNYMNKWCESWVKIHPENITGFRIGKKVSKGKTGRNYSIIFHVEKKIGPKEIKNIENTIPPYFNIEFPDGLTRKIKTDVEETGKFEFHLGIGSEVRSNYSPSDFYGSIGLFLTDSNKTRTFMLTNYHVAAWNLMNSNINNYLRDPSKIENDARVTDGVENFGGRFEIGEFSEEVDAAFIELTIQPKLFNSLPNGQYIGSPIEGPYSFSLINQFASVYSLSRPNGIVSTIVSNSSPFKTGYNGIIMKDVLLLDPPVTEHGDSGSIVVLTGNNSILGIVTGGDDKFTYVIPYYKINKFYALNIL